MSETHPAHALRHGPPGSDCREEAVCYPGDLSVKDTNPFDMGKFYISNSKGFPVNFKFPYIVVGVDNEPNGMFTNQIGAEMFLEALQFYGRIVDTRREEL